MAYPIFLEFCPDGSIRPFFRPNLTELKFSAFPHKRAGAAGHDTSVASTMKALYSALLFFILPVSEFLGVPSHHICHLLKYFDKHVYPPTRRTDASSIYGSQLRGTVVVEDPYRWLEQDSTERRAWALGLFLAYQKLRSILILLSSRSVFDGVSPPIFWTGSISHSCQK